jgi:hypothetical protein
MKIIPSLMCSCGEAEQDTAHILQTGKNHQALREEIWPLPTTLQEKLGISQEYNLNVVVNFALYGMCSMNDGFLFSFVVGTV